MPDFRGLHGLVWLFPKSNLGQFVIVPAVADDAVLRRFFAGQIIGLRGAGDRREGGIDYCRLAKRERNFEMAGVCSPMCLRLSPTTLRTAVRFTGERGLRRYRDDFLFPARLTVSQFVDGLDDQWQVHFVHFEPLAERLQQGDGEFPAQVLPEFLQSV